MKKIKLAVLLMEGVLPSAVFGLSDIFTICNLYCKRDDEQEISTTYVSIDKRLVLGDIQLKTKPISESENFDILIVPPMIHPIDFTIDPKLRQWIINQYHQGCIVAAACMGSFVLAQTGLLDFKKAVTHWLLEESFQKRFPNIILDREKILIDQGTLITAGGVTAYIDLALYLIEKNLSHLSANQCAALLLVDRGRESQKCYKDLCSVILVEDQAIKSLMTWMKKNLHHPMGIDLLSQKLELNKRTFMRRFHNASQLTPNQYLQNLRIEEAKALLVDTTKSFEDITFNVGYSNESTFRRLFKRETSLNPGEYRKKFKSYHP